MEIILGLELGGFCQDFPSTSLSLVLLGTTILLAGFMGQANTFFKISSLPSIVIFSTSVVFIIHLIIIYRQTKTVLSLRKITLSWSPLHSLVLAGTCLFSVSLFSSSFVEEEHQLWYFLWVTLGLMCLCSLLKLGHMFAWVSVLVTHRSLRTLNQTGDQWAHLPDLSDWLIKPENKTLLSIVFLISIILVLWCCFKLSSKPTSHFFCICSIICIFLHKVALQQVVAFVPSLTTSGTTEARLCLLLISLQLVCTRSVEGLVISWMLLVSLLLRPYNVALVPALFMFSYTLSHHLGSSTSPYISAVLHHWLGAVFFFYQGNSNSLASVDVAAGYVGLEEYNVGVVGTLLLIHTYAMPILAYLLKVQASIKRDRRWVLNVVASCRTVVFLQVLHVLVTFISVTIHRYHLFVWTVFSPKLLYVATQTFVVFIIVSITNICLYGFQRSKDCFKYKK